MACAARRSASRRPPSSPAITRTVRRRSGARRSRRSGRVERGPRAARARAPRARGSAAIIASAHARAAQQQRLVAGQLGDAEAADARLARADELALAAQPQVDLGEREAVVVARERAQPRRALRPAQQAQRGVLAAADAAAQLVQLRDPEALGVLDQHHRRVRHVDADLDHRRRDQHVGLARRRTRPSPPASRGGASWPCSSTRRRSRSSPRAQALELVGRGARAPSRRRPRLGLDERADDERLAPGAQLLARSARRRARARARPTITWVAIGRRPRGQLAQPRLRRGRRTRSSASVRGIGVAVMCSTCGARPARRLARERGALAHAEAVLLVDDRDRQRAEARPASSISACVPTTSEQLAAREPREQLGAPRARASSRSAARACTGSPPSSALERREVLLGERLGRRHQRRLASRARRRAASRTARRPSCRCRPRPSAAAASGAAAARSARASSIAARLVAGERERQPAGEPARASARRSPSSAIARRARVLARARGASSASWTQQQLVEGEPAAAALGLLGLAEVHRRERGAARRERQARRAGAAGQRVDDVARAAARSAVTSARICVLERPSLAG